MLAQEALPVRAAGRAPLQGPPGRASRVRGPLAVISRVRPPAPARRRVSLTPPPPPLSCSDWREGAFATTALARDGSGEDQYMAVTGDPLQRGSVVGGYRIDELISRGGMGLVYRVTNVALNRIYALKVLAPEFAADEQFRARFMREMRIAASLNNLNIVGIHHAGEHEGMLYFV